MVIRLALTFFLMAGVARAETLRLLVPEIAPVAGEMVPVTVRGEYTRLITLEKLTFPSSDQYDWMQVSRDSWTEERIDGRTVRVFQRRIAVFPRRAGRLTIGPVTHQLTVTGGPTGREALPVTAEPVTLTVAPFPAETPPLSARALTVEDSLSAPPGALGDGETLVRRMTIRAEGALPQQLPPRPAMREPWLISFAAPEIRETRPTPDGPVTTVTWEWHLRPRTGEPGVLPAVTIPWFDTAARRLRTAEIPAIPFGYVSFRENRGGLDRLPADQVWIAAAACGSGLVAGLAAALAGQARRRRADALRILRRLVPFDPTRRAVRRAARSGDLVALRRAADRYLARRRDLGLPVTGRETAELDAALYGRTPGSPDGKTVLASILARPRPPARNHGPAGTPG
ncbi:BatD family protein [Chthonobacter rhizosphaerae]|uniref:BatD family protein n=1 Tax=Chthonobacter rhizosphaerae TaxID=2735553 RepID=UPI0015EF4258|nr:BatD family protein [Chthonobacter rhizosphaerae]